MSENLIAERSRLQKHLTDLDAFLAGQAYLGWESARKQQIAYLELDIIEKVPTDRTKEIESFMNRGKRELLLDLETQFQDVRETLISRLDEIEELLQPNTEKQETNEN